MASKRLRASPYLQSLLGIKSFIFYQHCVCPERMFSAQVELLRIEISEEGGRKKKELEKTCRLNRSKSFYLNPLVGNCHGQSVIKAQTSLLHSSAESRHARHVLQKVTQLHITLSLWEHLFFPVISQGHMDITTCILSTESPGPEAEKGPISFRITI